MMIAPNAYRLAQLVDALPSWAWNALNIAGSSGPLLGLLISLATRSITSWKVQTVTVFYILVVPLGWPVFLARSNHSLAVCSFLILMPVGIILGLAVLTPRSRTSEMRRGFEVQIRREEGD